MNPKFRQLTFAREYRGLTQSELASRIVGLSQSNLSKFEKGLQTLSDELLSKILDYLKFPESFLGISIYNGIESEHFRKKSMLTMREKHQISRENKLVGYIVDCMSEELDYPDFNIRTLDLEDGYTPQAAATYARKFFRLGDLPVENIIDILERNGIIVVENRIPSPDFDGVSFITDKGYHIVIINHYMPNDRKRFTLAHELGHIIMHHSPNFIISDKRDIEKEANCFASEFLMPENAVAKSLKNLRFSSLGMLKSYWLCSMSSIIIRARDLGAIPKEKAESLMREMSRKGYRKLEPLEVPIDKPYIFREAYQLYIGSLNYTPQMMAEAFSLPSDVISDIFMEPEKVKFRIRTKF